MNKFDEIKNLENKIYSLLEKIKIIKPNLYQDYKNILNNYIIDYLDLGLDYINSNPNYTDILIKNLKDFINLLENYIKKYNIKEAMKLSELKQFIQEEYSSSKKVLAIGGVLVINPEVAKMKYILSDVRAVLGVTIVNNKEYQSGNPASKYEYAYLDVKIDPSPFPKGLNDTAHIVSKVEKDIKAIRGVVTFKLKEKAHDVKTWTIS